MNLHESNELSQHRDAGHLQRGVMEFPRHLTEFTVCTFTVCWFTRLLDSSDTMAPLEMASMKQVKSAFAGITAIILIVALPPLVANLAHLLFFFVRGLRAGGFGIAFGPMRWHMPSLNEWLLLFCAFGLGYFWELHRLERRTYHRTDDSSKRPTP